MDAFRYYVALLIAAASPSALLFWFSIHPFIRFWRKVGLRLTLAIHYGLLVALGLGVVLIRKPILSREFGTSPVLMALGGVLLLVAAAVRFHISRQLANKILSGFPEIAPSRYESKLLTEGIYSRIRHPRYLQLLLAFLGYALLTNYLAVYVLFVASVFWIFLVVPLEEKELRERFGQEYERYCQRVPRFIPRRSRPERKSSARSSI